MTNFFELDDDTILTNHSEQIFQFMDLFDLYPYYEEYRGKLSLAEYIRYHCWDTFKEWLYEVYYT